MCDTVLQKLRGSFCCPLLPVECGWYPVRLRQWCRQEVRAQTTAVSGKEEEETGSEGRRQHQFNEL